MFDGMLIAQGAVGTLTLLNNLVEMIKAAEAAGSPIAFSQVILEMPAQAYKLATRFIAEIDDVGEVFSNAGIDQNKTIADLESETWFFQRNRHKILRDFEPYINAIRHQLDNFGTDIVAIAHCKEADAIVAASLQKARTRNTKIAADSDVKTKSVADVLRGLRENCTDLQKELFEMASRRH